MPRRAEQLDGQGLAGIVLHRHVGQKLPGVEVNGVSAGRLKDGHPLGHEPLAQVLDRADAILQVVLVEHFVQPDGDGLQVAARQAAVGREALGDDQEVAGLGGQGVVVDGQESAHVDDGVFLGAHRRAVGVGEHLLDDALDGAVGVARLAELDEIGVFGEAAGVQEQGDAVPPADGLGAGGYFPWRPAGRRRSCSSP